MARIGTAGWAIPRAVADRFPAEGSGLQRYAAVFDAAEINATFYRSPRASTLERWVGTTPDHFRFAVKAPKAVTHEARLARVEGLLDTFAADIAPLQPKLGPVLVQLPPSLAFDLDVAATFFTELRARFAGAVACEPRHATWFTPDADALLREHRIARVAADPAKADGAEAPGGWPGLTYFRLHGAPRVYWSAYEAEALSRLAADLSNSEAERWCIFDNTASGAAAANALALRGLLRKG